MISLKDTSGFLQCSTWRKKINKIYGTNFSSKDIHAIFKSLKIPFYEVKIKGSNITYYEIKTTMLYIKNGMMQSKVSQWLKINNPSYIHTPTKTDYSNYRSEDEYKNKSITISQKESEPELYYINDENDVEKYSDYLINNVYENNIKMNKTVLNKKKLHEIVKESVKQIIKESRSIKSKKLYDIIKQHGGIKSNRGIFDIHNMTDEDIIGVFNWSELKDYKPNNLDTADEIDFIELKDGKYILAKCRGARFDRLSKSYNDNRIKTDGDFEFLNAKKDERTKNRYPRKEDYVWNNKDAEDLYKNPYFRRGEGDWTKNRKKEVMNNLKNKSKATISENDLHKIIKESVSKILSEIRNTERDNIC